MKKIKTLLFVICSCFVVHPAISLADARDPNEPGVTDDRDFNACQVKYDSGKGAIVVDIRFYDSPNFGSFWFYISTDNTSYADYGVWCYSSYISVREITSTGGVGPEVYRGRANLDGDKYGFKFPAKDIGLDLNTKNTIGYWFFWLAGGGSAADRLPDSGRLKLNIP